MDTKKPVENIEAPPSYPDIGQIHNFKAEINDY